MSEFASRSDFLHYPKIPRRENINAVITEKLDGTNAQIFIPGGGGTEFAEFSSIGFLVGSRNKWITPEKDNYGFARWAYENADKLLRLGPGRHYGEWWGQGIQRGYGLAEKRFSLFDARRWTPERLAERELQAVVSAVPILDIVTLDKLSDTMAKVAYSLELVGSVAAPGFMQPEGFVVQIGDSRFKVTDAVAGKKHEEPSKEDREAVQGGGLPESTLRAHGNTPPSPE